ncbi:YfgM family protein [Alkanindiges sp. WGS2144]|uniref:YfgM family protein n=1 Tax=Alkanindiges sp. WGS2144 TaxID=3366808 RepID=UPI003753E6D4
MSTHLSDEEQIDRFKGFLKAYGNAIITGILVALIIFFGWQYWQKKQAVERYNLATQYQHVVDAGQRLEANPDNQVLRSQYFSQADALVKASPDSAHALQAQFLSAKIAASKGDYAVAEKQLAAATKSKIKDQGLQQLAWLRLAYMQMAQAKLDDALSSLKQVNDPAFLPSANEAKGDILVQKNDLASAKTAYQAAWDALAQREEPRQLLQVKLESLGVTVPDLNIEGPVREPPQVQQQAVQQQSVQSDQSSPQSASGV